MNSKNLPVILLSILLALLILLGFFAKDNLNNFISQKMKTSGNETALSGKKLANSLFNYAENGLSYEFTILEFSTQNCTVCKQMEKVLEEISNCCSEKINIVFYNTMVPENQKLVSHFAIPAVPMQVLLDKKGNEFFRNYGFISAAGLKEKIDQKMADSN